MAILKNNAQTRFIIIFVGLFLVLYYFNIFFWGLVTPGGSYNAFLAAHFNYGGGLRDTLIVLSTKIIAALGYVVVHNTDEILIAGRGLVRINYDCLGLGVMSFFTAFVIAYPKPLKAKLIFLIAGLFTIQLLNLCRCVVLALYLGTSKMRLIDHHTIFNVFIYIIISVALYFYINETRHNSNAKN